MCVWNFISLQTKKFTEDFGVGRAELKVKSSSHKGNYLPACSACELMNPWEPRGKKSGNVPGWEWLGWSLPWSCEQTQEGTAESVWEHWQKQTLFLLGVKEIVCTDFSLAPFPSDFRRSMIVLQAQRGCMWQGNWACSLIFIQFYLFIFYFLRICLQFIGLMQIRN